MIKDFVKLEDIEEAEKGTDKGEKIKQLTAEFFKTHEQLNKLGTCLLYTSDAADE